MVAALVDEAEKLVKEGVAARLAAADSGAAAEAEADRAALLEAKGADANRSEAAGRADRPAPPRPAARRHRSSPAAENPVPGTRGRRQTEVMDVEVRPLRPRGGAGVRAVGASAVPGPGHR